MKRVCILAAAVVAGLSGCATPARFVEKSGDSGIVAIPANTDAWPGHYRREAMTLIHQHIGPDFEIVEEREVAVGQSTTRHQQVNTEKTVNSEIPFLPAEKQTVNNTTTVRDVTEYRIAYRRRAPQSGVIQTQYVPGATPNLPAAPVVPAIAGLGSSPAPGGVVPAAGTMPTNAPAGVMPKAPVAPMPPAGTLPRVPGGTSQKLSVFDSGPCKT